MVLHATGCWWPIKCRRRGCGTRCPSDARARGDGGSTRSGARPPCSLISPTTPRRIVRVAARGATSRAGGDARARRPTRIVGRGQPEHRAERPRARATRDVHHEREPAGSRGAPRSPWPRVRAHDGRRASRGPGAARRDARAGRGGRSRVGRLARASPPARGRRAPRRDAHDASGGGGRDQAAGRPRARPGAPAVAERPRASTGGARGPAAAPPGSRSATNIP